MKVLFPCTIALLLTIGATAQSRDCGKPAPAPAPSGPQTLSLDSALQAAEALYRRDPSNADNLIWYARRLGYRGRYDDAIAVLTEGVQRHPLDARMLRHRGHRYITVRCFDKAIADFTEAARLVQGKQDETEPDGAPNARNIPVSTLQQNIYYHLGLAHYLKGDYEEALEAYRQCMDRCNNEDMRVATANWMYLTLRHLGREVEAADLLATINPDAELIENGVYLRLLTMHQQRPAVEDPLKLVHESVPLESATYQYGLLAYCQLQGYEAQAEQLRASLLKQQAQWASFGYIAAESGR